MAVQRHIALFRASWGAHRGYKHNPTPLGLRIMRAVDDLRDVELFASMDARLSHHALMFALPMSEVIWQRKRDSE